MVAFANETNRYAFGSQLASTLDCSPPPVMAAAESAKQFVEAVGFCHDPQLQIAAAGTLDGYLVIWDTARLVRICAD